jgi:hypothetical protein
MMQDRVGLPDETIAVVMVDSEVTVLCRTGNGYRIETIVYPPMTGRPERGSRQITEAEAMAWVAAHGIDLGDSDAARS